MDLPMNNNDEDPLDRRAENDANEEQLIPDEEMLEDQQEMMLDDDEDLEEQEEEGEEDLRTRGARFRNIGLKAIYDNWRPFYDSEYAAPIILYLLYPDLRREIVLELPTWTWLVESGRFRICEVATMFEALGYLYFDEIEQEHSEALLEFVDELGSLMVAVQRKLLESSLRPTTPTLHDVEFPLHVPLGPIVAAKLLQYAQSVESITRLDLTCDLQRRAFRPDEVERLVSSILDLKQLEVLEVHFDFTGVLLAELCARLKEVENLSHFFVVADFEDVPQELPSDVHSIRSIHQISSLETLRLSFLILGESTVDLFSDSEAVCTTLELDRCRFNLDDDEDDTDPSELPLAVALASNTRLVDLTLHSVQGTRKFFEGIEHGLLKNRTLRTLKVSNYEGRANQRIPEYAYFGWMQSIRLHPSLLRLELDMTTWSGRVADAVCSVVRENTRLQSIELSHGGHVERADIELVPEWIGSILQALQGNRAIVDVRISVGADFGERNWDRLAELLDVNDSIESIQLYAGNESIPERVIELLQRVKSNRTLKQLGLENADFLPQHVQTLVRILSNNFVLASLVYKPDEPQDGVQRRERTPILCSDKQSKRLLKGILDLNYYGRKYMMADPNSVFCGVSLLSHVSSNLDAVYFHIRENPRLCERREWK